jgi:DNA repair protein RadC
MDGIYFFEKANQDTISTGFVDVRERILQMGTQSISDTDLLAAILGSGINGKSVIKLASEVLDLVDKGKTDIDMDILQRISGMGEAKACAVASSIELGRRFFSIRDKRIAMPKDVYPLIAHFADRKQEHFLCVSLNGAHEVNEIRVVSTGLVNKTVVHPREVFADPITDRACAVIIAHNHPSGNVEPSQEDIEITKRLKNAGDILGIPILDHLVFSGKTFFSFVEHGLITLFEPD